MNKKFVIARASLSASPSPSLSPSPSPHAEGTLAHNAPSSSEVSIGEAYSYGERLSTNKIWGRLQSIALSILHPPPKAVADQETQSRLTVPALIAIWIAWRAKITLNLGLQSI